jgi:uncharacterized protein YkwD
MNILAHLFSPRASNRHKAKILHPTSLFIIALLVGVLQFGIHRAPVTHQSVLGYAAQISVNDVIKFTNEKRAAAGLSPVTFNQTLTDAALEKGHYMIDHDFWAHVAPDGTEPWFFFQKHGYKYRYAGENLARDFSNASAAVDAWMASPSHRDNMLSAKYKDIGVAVVEGDLSGSDTTIIVQLFGTTLSDASSSVPVAKAQTNVSPTKQPVKAAVTSISPTSAITETPIPTTEAETVAKTETQQLVSDNAPIATPSGVSLFLSQFETTKGISLLVLGILFIITAIDGIIIFAKNIKRRGGRTFAHLAFFGMIIIVVIILRAGKIL